MESHLQEILSKLGHFGRIAPKDRTPAQQDAHQRALAKRVPFDLTIPDVPVGTKVMLTDVWKHPTIVADIGQPFTGFYQFTGSCFAANTPIRMADGEEKPIQDVKVGDEVVTHEGRVRRVVQTMNRRFTGEMVTLKVSGFPFPLEMTADHQVAISVPWCDGVQWKRADEIEEGDKVLLGWNRQEAEPQTLDTAALLGGDCVILDELMKDGAFTKGNEADVPNANVGSAREMVKRSGIDWKGRVRLRRSRIENAIFRNVPVCPSLGRLLGLYLAEGGYHEGRVVFTFNADEKDTLAAEVLSLVRGLFGVEGELVYQDHRPNVVKVRFSNVNLAEVFKALIPGNVYTKRVPGLFFNATEETRLALLLGWMAGDGYVGVKGGKNPGNIRITGVTTCEGLARDMTTLALSCGLRATAGQRKARQQSKVSYGVDLCGQKAVRLFAAVAHRAEGPRYTDKDAAQTPYGYARKVLRIERRYVEMLPVFDFEVEEDHSFIAGGLVVHNCVGVSTGNAVMTLSGVQRLLATNPTKAMVPFWPYDYGTCRVNEGDSGQGEGAVDSVMFQTLIDNGVLDSAEPGLPKFSVTGDGYQLSESLEMKWSDGRADTSWANAAKKYPLKSAATLNTVDDIIAAVLNGYPVLDGCNDYIGGGQVDSNGVCLGRYDGSGGHSTCYLGAWLHPVLGWLLLYSNQWATSTYPDDTSGKGRCTTWVKRADAAKLFQLGGDGGETAALSGLTYLPAQPAVVDVLNWTP